jgi:AraC-like DNA-binding protein
MDLMSRAIDEMRLRGAAYRSQSLRSHAVISQPSAAAGIHLVLRGHTLLRHGASSFVLSAGDLVLLPQSPAHTVQLGAAGTAVDYAELLSGRLDFESADHPLFSVLPPVVHASAAQLAQNPRMPGYVEQIVEEVRSARDGSDALVARLSEVILIEVMRFFTPAPGIECPVGGWFSALRDPALRRVLSAIHEDPSKDWTVATLAKVASESRSAFAAHFASVMREPPMAYLARWRMFRARALLRQTELPLDAIAELVGYGSAAAFSLAFARAHETAPGAYRRGWERERGSSESSR